MTLIFWQGIISIHQKTFLEALAKQPEVQKVLMVVENEITPYRKNMGWEVPKIEGVPIIVSPSKQEICEIFDANKDAVHILGGIRVGQMMTTALEVGAKRKARMGSLSEPYERSGIKGKLRDLKYQYLRLFYFRHIDFFLAVGREGVATYTRLGFRADRVFPWAYFVSVPLPPAKPAPVPGTTRIIYAGRIEEGKGISRFVAELVSSQNGAYSLDIYGGGPDEAALKQFVAQSSAAGKINFFPFLPYNELIQQYARYDWVVLPSVKKDGWGVIVSEGLLNGLKAICSNKCGVSWAIKEKYNGVTFDWWEQDSCSRAIDLMLAGKGFADPETIKELASRSLSGEAGARYYLQILASVYNGKSKPEIPWA